MNYFGDESISEYLAHYGKGHLDGGHSGRYPWGSGETPYQHSNEWLSRVRELRDQKITFVDPDTGKVYTGDTAIAKTMKMSTTEFRAFESIAIGEEKAAVVSRIKELQAKGMNPSQIGRELGLNESTIRSKLNEDSLRKQAAAKSTAMILKEYVDKNEMADVGEGIARRLGVSDEKLKQALVMLQAEGYNVYQIGIPNVTNPGRQINTSVLTTPDKEYKDAYDFGSIHFISSPDSEFVSNDNGETFRKPFQYPESMDSSRLMIRYAEDGGALKDGLIELRKGVKDLSLGDANYAQVRILVDNDKYLKGMAVYGDDKDFPEGVDVIFNSHHGKDEDYSNLKDAKKNLKKDPTNPFGSAIKEKGGQSTYIGDDGKEHLSLINKREEEGGWREWSKKLPAQFLSKQSKSLVDRQLNLAAEDKRAEYEEIMALNQPTIQKHLLEELALECDSAAVDLKAAALPRQAYKVILPINSLKNDEIYAPSYNDGERVALVRFPHQGTYEIPILTVNNKNTEGKGIMGPNPQDAVGITSSVAERLSGADFDGDTVMVIPCNSRGSRVNIISRNELEGLKGFDPSIEYPEREGMKYMTNTENEMGVISNLITDMTLLGASDEELVRATKHALVVIDAEKHKYDYKRSYEENNIKELKDIYQGHYNEKGNWVHGAGTLISRAKSETEVQKRQGSGRIDPETGKISYKLSDDLYYQEVNMKVINKDTGKEEVKKYKQTVYKDKDGNFYGKYYDPSKPILERTQKSTKMMETEDAYSLISEANTQIEQSYANYANRMKALANECRKEAMSIKETPYSSAAKKEYSEEVASLMAQLNIAESNAPRERQAQAITNSIVKARIKDNPELKNDKESLKKIKNQTLAKARVEVGAKREAIEISDREWKAIQAGAIPKTTLKRILVKTDVDKLKEMSMPRETRSLSNSQMIRIRALKNSEYTNAQIAEALNISENRVASFLRSEKEVN